MKAVMVIGISLTAIGVVLLFRYQEPSSGSGFKSESYNRRANAIGARLGLGCALAGVVLEIIAAIGS